MTREQILDTAIRNILRGSGMSAKELKLHLFRRNWQIYRNLIVAFFKNPEGFHQ